MTTATNHTPGPWAFDGNDLVTYGTHGTHVARIATTGTGYAVRPNGRLIAAAPTMLEALKAAQKMAASGAAPLPPSDPRWAQIADAISLAEQGE